MCAQHKQYPCGEKPHRALANSFHYEYRYPMGPTTAAPQTCTECCHPDRHRKTRDGSCVFSLARDRPSDSQRVELGRRRACSRFCFFQPLSLKYVFEGSTPYMQTVYPDSSMLMLSSSSPSIVDCYECISEDLRMSAWFEGYQRRRLKLLHQRHDFVFSDDCGNLYDLTISNYFWLLHTIFLQFLIIFSNF